MANIEECPGFETFGTDVKAARMEMRLSRQKVAEMIGVSPYYLSNIENDQKIPSLPVMIQLTKIFGLPMERYFTPAVPSDQSEQRQRVIHKAKICPEQYLFIIEGALDRAIGST
ncbi:MAG: helix-turn-helix transcriptional regulator [Dysosmobacter sp.]|nr:helix-turn-helix transcriptional regulator [Dysosmobacter sp.]